MHSVAKPHDIRTIERDRCGVPIGLWAAYCATCNMFVGHQTLEENAQRDALAHDRAAKAQLRECKDYNPIVLVVAD